MRDIPPKANLDPLLLSTREEYIEWLKSLDFTDSRGMLIEPNYENLAPPLEELPMLVIYTGDEDNPFVIRPLCLH